MNIDFGMWYFGYTPKTRETKWGVSRFTRCQYPPMENHPKLFQFINKFGGN